MRTRKTAAGNIRLDKYLYNAKYILTVSRRPNVGVGYREGPGNETAVSTFGPQVAVVRFRRYWTFDVKTVRGRDGF